MSKKLNESSQMSPLAEYVEKNLHSLSYASESDANKSPMSCPCFVSNYSFTINVALVMVTNATTIEGQLASLTRAIEGLTKHVQEQVAQIARLINKVDNIDASHVMGKQVEAHNEVEAPTKQHYMRRTSMHWGLHYILQGILPKSFEESATRAHDMKLSITKLQTRNASFKLKNTAKDNVFPKNNVPYGKPQRKLTLKEMQARNEATRDEDLLLGSKPHNRPLFVAGYAREQNVNRILIDGGSAVNILPLRTLKELGIPIDELSNSCLMIQGFNQGGQRAIDVIRMELLMDDMMSTTLFHVIDAKTFYNMLLGRPWLHENFVVHSTWHQCFKYCRNGTVRKGFVPSTQEEEGGHETLVIDEKRFDPKAFKLLIKAGYNSKEKLSFRKHPHEATGKKLHGLNATQVMLKKNGHAIQDSRVSLGIKPIRIAIKRVNNNYITKGFSSTKDDNNKEKAERLCLQ
ncbi:hypothetical protein Sango_2995100 [Sesamum angolense]|uniref:Uncharacterized protein n=1 Tax=Sesamum angolense TaxID=2727404 RepID=A0AAE1VXB6_9LAMI|nr:hypothetical protein Sango_2995100 [Sesamum angolense]